MLSLDDSHGKICTAVGMAVAAIGQYDWPEEWHELLPFLLKLINDESNQNGVRGALRCLALLSGDLDDASVPKLVPELFSSLHKIISSSELYEKNLRAKALSIAHACISVLGPMSGVYQKETTNMVKSILTPLMEQLSIILQSPVQSEYPDNWGLRLEVLKCLLQIIQNFPSTLDGPFLGILAPLWQTFISSFSVYQLSCVQGTEDLHSGRYDTDGTEQSFEAIVIQEHSWSLDANHYVADEDDATYSCRVSGTLLLEEIVNTYGQEGIDLVLEACQARFHESCEAKVSGHSDWWKDSEPTKYNLGQLIERTVTESAGVGVDVHPFLHARAFAMVAKFHSVISKSTCEQFLYRASQAISLDVPPPVKVGACRALSQVLPESKQEAIQPNIMNLLSSLTDLLTKEKKSNGSFVMDKDNAEEISSVDEDCSRGMKKWLMEYKESKPGIDVLQQQIDDIISAHEAKLEQEKQEREAAAEEGGWAVVVHQKGRKKTTDAESRITVGSVAPAAVLDKMSKKKSKEVTMDFYRFQKQEAQRNEIMMLQEKFEQDKKRIQQLRAARKFRPY